MMGNSKFWKPDTARLIETWTSRPGSRSWLGTTLLFAWGTPPSAKTRIQTGFALRLSVFMRGDAMARTACSNTAKAAWSTAPDLPAGAAATGDTEVGTADGAMAMTVAAMPVVATTGHIKFSERATALAGETWM